MLLPVQRGASGERVMRRELLHLVLAVLLVDALFIAAYFFFHLERAAVPAKVGFAAAWTVVTLVIVLRALARIRARRYGR